MNGPLISVVLPVYNVENWLSECIDSILRQEESRFEVVAVNDGSTDSSRDILARYAEIDNRIRIIDQPNMGLASARNTGVAESRGKYIAFIDSDDYVDQSYLSTLLHNIILYKVDISVCGRAIDCDGNITHEFRPGFANKILVPEHAFRALNSYKSFDMSMCGKLILRELFKGITFPVGKNSEDQFVCFKLLLKAKRIYYVDAPLYYYRHRSGSISRGFRVNVFPIEASGEQLRFIELSHPNLTFAAKTSCLFSQISVFNAFVIRHREIPDYIMRSIRKDAPRYFFTVLFNPDISVFKKMQALAFIFCRPVYKYIYLNKRGRLT